MNRERKYAELRRHIQNETALKVYGVTLDEMDAIERDCRKRRFRSPRDAFRVWKRNRVHSGKRVTLRFIDWWGVIAPHWSKYGRGSGKYQVVVLDPDENVDVDNIEAMPCEQATTPYRHR